MKDLETADAAPGDGSREPEQQPRPSDEGSQPAAEAEPPTALRPDQEQRGLEVADSEAVSPASEQPEPAAGALRPDQEQRGLEVADSEAVSPASEHPEPAAGTLKPDQEQRGLEVADSEAVWIDEGGGPSAAELKATEQTGEQAAQPDASTEFSVEDLLGPAETPFPVQDTQLRAVLEAIVYVAEDPLTLAQLAAALHQPAERIRALMEQMAAEFEKPEHGITLRELAGGYKMATKPEHHEDVRAFVKSLKPPLKLSLPALETLAVIAYKQPVTAPEIMEIRGVQGTGVLKTLLDRKLIAVAGRKNVIGKPILYKTTKEFLIQFGLKDLGELPSLKEFEEIRRMALSDGESPAAPAAEPAAPVAESAAPPAEPAAPPTSEEAPGPVPEPPADQES